MAPNGASPEQFYTVSINVHCAYQRRLIESRPLCGGIDDYEEHIHGEDVFDDMLNAAVGPPNIMYLSHDFTYQQALELQTAIQQGQYDIALPMPGNTVVLKPLIIVSPIKLPDLDSVAAGLEERLAS